MELKRMQLHHWMMIITFSLVIFLPGSQLMTTSTSTTTAMTTTAATTALKEAMLTMSPASSSLTTATDKEEITETVTVTSSMPTTITPMTTILTTTTPKGALSSSIPKIVEAATPRVTTRVENQEAAKSLILKSNRTNDKIFLRSQSKRELSAEVKSPTLISAATTGITTANITTNNVTGTGEGAEAEVEAEVEAAIINNNNNVNNKIVNRSLSIATKGSFNTTAAAAAAVVVNREQDIVIDREPIVMPAAEGLTTTKALTIAGREQSTLTMETAKLLATLAPNEQLLPSNKVASTHNKHNNNHRDASADDDDDVDVDDADDDDVGNNNENIVNNISNNNNNNNNRNSKMKYQRSARHSNNNEGQNSDQTYMLTTEAATTSSPPIPMPDTTRAAVAAAAVAQPPVNNILLATAAAESNLIMTNIEENENENELKPPLNRNHQQQTLATATFETTTTIDSTSTTTNPPTTTSRTTRRPIPTTTLKPPPTIDDYQTIIAQAGTHAYLPCNVKQLVKKPISWLRVRDGHILTVDQTTFIADQRFQSVYSSKPERWSLQIKYVQLKDEGTYECQVSTEPKASAIVHLRIVEPKTELIGESTRHVKAGSQVKLRCIISQALEPPLFINWFYNQKQIYLHNRRGWRTEIERIDLPLPTTELPTTQAQPAIGNVAMPTRPYLLDAAGITVHDGDGGGGGGGGYVLVASSEMTATAQILESSATMDVASASAASATSTAASAMQRTPNGIPTTSASVTTATATSAYSLATTLSALQQQQQQLATGTTMSTATTTSSTTSTTTTTTTPQPTTTTMLPTIAFIKQLTTASLIIPSVVKQDSGNYTCSPSNSASRTIVLHVLNGEYSASAITSAGVSWQPLFGSFRQLPRISLKWSNVSTFLTVLWIMKFLVASNITKFQWGYRSVSSNNGNATHKNNKDLQMRFYCRQRRPRLRKTKAPLISLPSPPPPSSLPQKSTFNNDDNVNNEVATIATTIQFACNNNDSAAKDLTRTGGYAEANNKVDISDSHKRHHKCDSSISGTKVEEDKT